MRHRRMSSRSLGDGPSPNFRSLQALAEYLRVCVHAPARRFSLGARQLPGTGNDVVACVEDALAHFAHAFRARTRALLMKGFAVMYAHCLVCWACLVCRGVQAGSGNLDNRAVLVLRRIRLGCSAAPAQKGKAQHQKTTEQGAGPRYSPLRPLNVL